MQGDRDRFLVLFLLLWSDKLHQGWLNHEKKKKQENFL